MKNLISKALVILCIALAVFLFKQCEANKNCNHEFKEPKGLITTEQANSYEENYKKHQYSYINEFLNNNGIPYEDSRAIRFELEELENYIHYVKEEAKKMELEGELSLRVYFGAKNSKFEKQNDNVMRSTLFFVPTHREITRNKEQIHENIYKINPLNMGSAGDPDNIEYGGN